MKCRQVISLLWNLRHLQNSPLQLADTTLVAFYCSGRWRGIILPLFLQTLFFWQQKVQFQTFESKVSQSIFCFIHIRRARDHRCRSFMREHITKFIWKRRNYIKELKNDVGNWVVDQADMKDLAMNFQCLVRDTSSTIESWSVGKVKHLVSQAMNDLLTTPYTKDEVKKDLFNIGDLKAPGLMDYMQFFIKSFGMW